MVTAPAAALLCPQDRGGTARRRRRQRPAWSSPRRGASLPPASILGALREGASHRRRSLGRHPLRRALPACAADDGERFRAGGRAFVGGAVGSRSRLRFRRPSCQRGRPRAGALPRVPARDGGAVGASPAAFLAIAAVACQRFPLCSAAVPLSLQCDRLVLRCAGPARAPWLWHRQVRPRRPELQPLPVLEDPRAWRLPDGEKVLPHVRARPRDGRTAHLVVCRAECASAARARARPGRSPKSSSAAAAASQDTPPAAPGCSIDALRCEGVSLQLLRIGPCRLFCGRRGASAPASRVPFPPVESDASAVCEPLAQLLERGAVRFPAHATR